ncbi:MAG: FUSC family protein, partial [Solirubrobacteraceae bacterium]
YVDSADYLSSAVAYGVGRCDASGPSGPKPTDESSRAAAAARRLDDTFRGYLAERGAKPVRLAEVTRLVTGVSGLRLAADAVIELWDRDDGGAADRAADRAAASAELLERTRQLNSWYDGFAASLSGSGIVPEPLPADDSADERLAETVGQDLRDADGHGTATGVRVIWTGDHLDAARRLQGMLVGPALEAVSEEALV